MQFVNIIVHQHYDTRWSSYPDAVKAIPVQLDDLGIHRLKQSIQGKMQHNQSSFEHIQKVLHTEGISFTQTSTLLQTLTNKLDIVRNVLNNDVITKIVMSGMSLSLNGLEGSARCQGRILTTVH